MVEQPKPLADPPPSTRDGGRTERPHNAFDIWIHGALRQLFGAVADEPVPEALRRLAGGEAPPAAGKNSARARPCRRCDPPDA
jgi:hypothetical protein